MKFVLKLGMFLLSLIFLILIIALFVKKDFKVERTVSVERDISDVYDYLRYLEHQKEFGVWFKIDPNMESKIKGIDGEENATLHWESNNENVGVGSMKLSSLDENRYIVHELTFKEPMESSLSSSYKLESIGEETNVKWIIEGSSPWPFNFLLLFMNMDSEMGADLDKSLANLKSTLE